MQAQEALNEDALVDEQPPEVEDDLNDIDVENQAPINHIDDYMKDYMMDKDKEFDDKHNRERSCDDTCRKRENERSTETG